ncbi:density-regulated protein homolog [Saccoglossus kowalevskii]|uniref:Density-regulated protein n=1 Tax=Saccoglossus kowalevskii TaxID=10224 RepID=A0ABM0GI81_SACKO|nr:PREDICTED: density-regulated protein-like isoform 1 [Saccoglossus kowalevskii]XP_002730388.1 PREDICTED: density-regulated protein-like isoform 3 [Saccoglossus kowalevskii]
MASADVEDVPQKDVSYPRKLIYCGECTMPLEFCEFHPNYEKCKKWLEKNLPDQFDALMRLSEDDPTAGGEGEKKKQKRGGRGMIKTRKKTGPQKVTIARMQRNKRKYVTVVRGLSTFDIDLKVASKHFANRFATGSSVTGDDEIVIQGDVTYDIIDVVQDKWAEIEDEMIEDLGDQKR